MGELTYQLRGLFTTLAVSSIFVSCSILLCFYILPELLKRSFHRLLFYLCISDILLAVACCIWFSYGVATGERCSAFFFLFYTFRNMSILINAVMFSGLFFVIGYQKPFTKRAEISLVSLSFLVPALLSIADMCLSPLESKKYLVDDYRRGDDFVLDGACFIEEKDGDAHNIGILLSFVLPALTVLYMGALGACILYWIYKEESDELKRFYAKAYRRVKFYLLNFCVFNFLITSLSGGKNWSYQGVVVCISLVNGGIFYWMNKTVLRRVRAKLRAIYGENATKDKSEGKTSVSLQFALFDEFYVHVEDDRSTSGSIDIDNVEMQQEVVSPLGSIHSKDVSSADYNSDGSKISAHVVAGEQSVT